MKTICLFLGLLGFAGWFFYGATNRWHDDNGININGLSSLFCLFCIYWIYTKLDTK